MDEESDGQLDRQTIEWTEDQVDSQIMVGRLMMGQIDKQMNQWTCGQNDKPTGRHTDKWKKILVQTKEWQNQSVTSGLTDDRTGGLTMAYERTVG